MVRNGWHSAYVLFKILSFYFYVTVFNIDNRNKFFTPHFYIIEK